MIKSKKLLIFCLLATIVMLSSCDYTTKNSAYDNITFTIKNGTEVTGSTLNHGNKNQNKRILDLLSKDYDIYKVTLYEAYNENSDLVVAYTHPNKILLCYYTDNTLGYIPLPDNAVIQYVYMNEGFVDDGGSTLPDDIKQYVDKLMMTQNFFSLEDVLAPKLTAEEAEQWAEYYETQDNAETGTINREGLLGYNFDFNNDQVDDILLVSAYTYASEYRLQGTKDGEYVVSKDAIFNYEVDEASFKDGYSSIQPIIYNGKSYIIHSNHNRYTPIDSISTSYVTTENNKNILQAETVENYLVGYTHDEFNDLIMYGYDDIPQYLVNRLDVANIASLKALGTAENNAKYIKSDSKEEITVTADFNNDGKDDTITKQYAYRESGSIFPSIVISSDDQSLANIINNIDIDGATTEAIFLDETKYGNILIVVGGRFKHIGAINAYKITGENIELLGRIVVNDFLFGKHTYE